MAGEREFRTEITADRTQFDATMEGMAQKAMTESQRMQSSMREAFVDVGNAAGESVKKMNSQFDALAEGVKAVRGVFAAVAAVIGGGAMFGKAINETAALTEETRKLSTTLGISLEQASALRIALGDVGVTTDEYTSMVGKMTMKLRENEERFNELGIKTRGANGELLDTEAITTNALEAMKQFREGTDRNLASTEIWGRGWNEVNKLLKVSPDLMEEARKRAVALELQIGPAGAERARAYKLAMNEIKDVGEALANRVGQALMPVLTDLANFLSNIGPAAVTVMRGALGGILTVVYAVENGIVVMVRVISAALYTVIEPMAAVAEATALAVTGHFAESAARMKAIPGNIAARWKDEFAEILKSGDTTRERIAALFDPGAEQGMTAPGGGGGRRWTPKAGAPAAEPAEKSRMTQWEAELAAQRDAYDKEKLEQGSFQQYTLAMERDYWKKILDTVAITDDERALVSKKYYAAELQLRKQAFEGEIADIKERIAQQRKGSVERIALAGEAGAKIGEKYGLESKEYKAALTEMSKMSKERGEQQKTLEALEIQRTKEQKVGLLELERQALDDAEKLGLISSQKKLERLKQLKELEYQIELKAETDIAKIYEMDEVAYAQHLERLAKLKQKHAAENAKIDGQMAMDQKKTLDLWFDPIANSFQGIMQGMIQGTMTWGQAVRRAVLQVGSEYASIALKMAMDWVKAEILKTNATVAGVAVRGAAEKTGAAESVLMSAWSAIKVIGIKAWEAAAAVYASIAAIPVIGPFLAPVMAVAAAGLILSFVGKIGSAEGGYDVPAGVNPVMQLHGGEMVLPPHLSNMFRAIAGDGAGPGAGAAAGARASEGRIRGMPPHEWLMVHRGDLVAALRSAHRDFSFTRF